MQLRRNKCGEALGLDGAAEANRSLQLARRHNRRSKAPSRGATTAIFRRYAVALQVQACAGDNREGRQSPAEAPRTGFRRNRFDDLWPWRRRLRESATERIRHRGAAHLETHIKFQTRNTIIVTYTDNLDRRRERFRVIRRFSGAQGYCPPQQPLIGMESMR